MLRENLDKLRAPLPLETAKEWNDSAMDGGTSRFYMAITQQALDAIASGDDGISRLLVRTFRSNRTSGASN